MMNASILLMIKYPNQRQASVDYKMVRPIDVGATIIDILKFKPPWNIDGQSLVSDDWKEVSPPLDFYQLLFKDNSYKARSKGLWMEGDIIKPTVYFEVFKEKLKKISVTKSKWIGSEADKLALSDKKAGKLEYLKIEKALPAEKNGEFVLTLGGYSFDPNLNPSTQTYIAVNNMIIKSIKPCLSFTLAHHKIGDVLGGWVVTIPRAVINSKKLEIRAFSPVENNEGDLFYELEDPINIELTDEQFQKVGK